MEIKLEQRDHDLDHLLGILSEAFLQLPSVTHQHLTRSGLLLQTSSPYPKTLLPREKCKHPYSVLAGLQAPWEHYEFHL